MGAIKPMQNAGDESQVGVWTPFKAEICHATVVLELDDVYQGRRLGSRGACAVLGHGWWPPSSAQECGKQPSSLKSLCGRCVDVVQRRAMCWAKGMRVQCISSFIAIKPLQAAGDDSQLGVWNCGVRVTNLISSCEFVWRMC
jgi:hypothetical protein